MDRWALGICACTLKQWRQHKFEGLVRIFFSKLVWILGRSLTRLIFNTFLAAVYEWQHRCQRSKFNIKNCEHWTSATNTLINSTSTEFIELEQVPHVHTFLMEQEKKLFLFDSIHESTKFNYKKAWLIIYYQTVFMLLTLGISDWARSFNRMYVQCTIFTSSTSVWWTKRIFFWNVFTFRFIHSGKWNEAQ